MTKAKATTSLLPAMPVPDVLKALNDKINSLKHIEESKYKTAGILEQFGNIKDEMKIENLIRAYSSIIGREKLYNEAAAQLGRGKCYPAFVVSGGTAEDWKNDIQLRINILEHKETLDKLNTYKEKMSKFLSEADQKEILMREMAEFLTTTGALA